MKCIKNTIYDYIHTYIYVSKKKIAKITNDYNKFSEVICKSKYK